MINIESHIRQNIKQLLPYFSARDEFQGDTGIFLDANELPFGTYNRYPDPQQKVLKTAIGTLKNIAVDNIFLGNGSDEAIDLAYRIFCEPKKHKALVFCPTYGMYEVSAAVNDVELIKLELRNDFQIDLEDVKPYLTDENLKLIFICNPNNPTGNNLSATSIDYILNHFNGIVIIDEAYIDFSSSASFIEYISAYNNLIVLQTFSKAWGLAGVRIGMAFSNTTIIQYFNKIKSPYNISQPNQNEVLQKLNQLSDFKEEVAMIISERNKIANVLKKISCVIKVHPSASNFLLVEVKDANYIYDRLIQENVIVRNRSNVIRNCLRITIGTEEENKKLITALKKINDD